MINLIKKDKPKTCRICGEPVYAKGLCKKHYIEDYYKHHERKPVNRREHLMNLLSRFKFIRNAEGFIDLDPEYEREVSERARKMSIFYNSSPSEIIYMMNKEDNFEAIDEIAREIEW